jgi:hypothetical protein
MHFLLDCTRCPGCAALQLLDLERPLLVQPLRYVPDDAQRVQAILAGARGVDLLCDARHSLDLDQAEMQSPNEKNGSAKTECARKQNCCG